MTVSAIDRHDLAGVWPQAATLLADPLSRAGEMTLDDLLDRLLTDELRLLVGTDTPAREVLAAFVLGVEEYPRMKSVRVILASGTPMADWLDPLIGAVEVICTTIGATSMELYGRPGWTRALRDRAHEQYTVMVRSVPA